MALVVFMLMIYTPAKGQFFYGVQQEFGKNRVVYQNFNWNFYRLPQYDVFYYHRGNRNAQYVTAILKDELKELSDFFHVDFTERFQVVCYNSLTELKQSNLNDNSSQAYNVGGVTSINGNKLFVYGTGLRKDLKVQLRAGITEMLLNYMVAGGDFKKGLETYRNLSLPTWFADGLILYMSETDNKAELEARMRDGLIYENIDNFNSFSVEKSQVLGYSIWNYLSHRYGEEIIPMVVLMTYTTRDIKVGFESVLGIDYKTIRENWLDYYSEIFKIDLSEKIENLPNEVAKSRNEERIFQLSTNSDNSLIAYTTNSMGLFNVYTFNTKTKKREKVFKGGYRITQNEDLSYPIISWHPDNKHIAMVAEKKGLIYLYIYDTELKKVSFEKSYRGLSKINSISFSKSGDKLVMSATQNGYTDIFVLNLKANTFVNLTKDSYDDLYPAFINGDNDIVFSSNRYNNKIVKSKKFALGKDYTDLFVYDYKNKSITLKKATESEYTSEIIPKLNKDNSVIYLATDEHNIQNQYVFDMDSIVSHVDTIVHYRTTFDNYKLQSDNRSVLNHDINDDKNTTIKYNDDKDRIELVDNLSALVNISKNNHEYTLVDTTKNEANEGSVQELKLNIKQYPINIGKYVFEPEIYNMYGVEGRFNDRYNFITTPDSLNPEIKILERNKFEKYKRLYRNIYFATELTTQIDQSSDNLDYQVFTGGPVYMSSGVNGLFEVKLTDVFNNNSLTGGFRTDFYPVAGLSLSPNSEFKLKYDVRKKRWNKSYLFYRRSQYRVIGPGEGNKPEWIPLGDNFYRVNLITNKFQYKLSYPFSPVSSASLSVGYRRDKNVLLNHEEKSLSAPITYDHFFTTRLDHTFDNTINYSLNLHRGTRIKTFAELYQGFNGADETMINLGFDARNYTRIHRNVIWANRFAMGTSLGTQRLVYYIGGVDNSFIPSAISNFDNTVPASPDINYGFQTLMTNMRGFKQNVRHGTSFALFNSEVRIPMIQYFFDTPISWSVLRHFQVVPFFDVGTAWVGVAPWSEENTTNNEIINRESIRVTIDRNNDSFVYGYGIGARTQMFGYFIRADWAWGTDTGKQLPKTFYLSLNLDF